METLQAGKKTKIIFLIFIIFFVVLQSYPVFWVLIASLKTPEEIAGSAPYALPGSFYLGNYIKAFTQSSLVRYFLNSVVVAICTLFGSTKCTGGLCDQQNSLQTERKGINLFFTWHDDSHIFMSDPNVPDL